MAVTSELITVAQSSLGGSITAILLREQAIRQRQSPLIGPLGTQNPRPFLAGIPITTRKQEVTSLEAEVTKHVVEAGSILSDHVILLPIILDLEFDVTNWDKEYAKQAQGLLEQLFFSRTPMDLQTEHKQLSNMVMTSLEFENSAPLWGKLNCRSSFQQLSFVTIETEDFPSEKVAPTSKTGGPDTPRSLETATNNGRQVVSKAVPFATG